MVLFMFGVLGSLVFWCVYFIVSFIVGSTLLKRIAPKTFDRVMTGSKENAWDSDIGWFFIFVGIYLFWPVWLIYKTMCLMMTWVLLPLMRKSIMAASSVIPDIEVKKRKES